MRPPSDLIEIFQPEQRSTMATRVFHLLVLLLAAAFAAAATAQTRDFLLGPGDLISIKVFQNPDLSGEVRISETGTIAFPLVGDLKVSGLTTNDVGALISKRLQDGNFVKQPSVTVGIAQFRSLQVSVLGQVTRPGKYPLEQSLNRVSEIVALAGGVTAAGADTLWLIRQDGGKERKIEIDLPGLMQAGDPSKDIAVKNGDTVFVPRAPVFYIYGEAQRTGQYRIERGMNVTQALAVGGGPTTRGTDKGVRLSRRDANGNLATREANPNEPILPDDILQVRERLF
jgi:polysaccharide export outer membrane protein